MLAGEGSVINGATLFSFFIIKVDLLVICQVTIRQIKAYREFSIFPNVWPWSLQRKKTAFPRYFTKQVKIYKHSFNRAVKVCQGALNWPSVTTSYRLHPIHWASQGPHQPLREGQPANWSLISLCVQKVGAWFLPSLSSTGRERLEPIKGTVPDPFEIPKGCGFRPRCHHAMDECGIERPALVEAAPDHFAACHLVPTKGAQ